MRCAIAILAAAIMIVPSDGHAQDQARRNEQLVRACDLAAAAPADQTRPAGVPGVEFSRVDTTKAIRACELAVAADPGSARLKFQLGRAHSKANAAAKAASLYQEAVSGGHASAHAALAYLYAQGEGVPKDQRKARALYEKAVAMGDTAGMRGLGRTYLRGEGVSKDAPRGMALFEKAAALGDSSAMRQLGDIYRSGEGVPQSYAKALEWYERAVAANHPEAMTSIGVMHDSGRGVAQDHGKAREWYLKAAALGETTAMQNLGKVYESGRGVGKDLGRARGWYEKAAAAGHASSMRILASMFEEGKGVRKDARQAAKWREAAVKIDGRTPEVDEVLKHVALSSALIASASACGAPARDVTSAAGHLFNHLQQKHPKMIESWATRQSIDEKIATMVETARKSWDDKEEPRGFIFGMPCSRHLVGMEEMLKQKASFFNF